MQFHEKLKELRKGRQLTQKELADEIHVSRSAVAKWENGLGLPSDESLQEIAVFFGVNLEDLLIDREIETVIVEKNGKLSRQKKWLIAFIALACALLIAATALLGVFLTQREVSAGGDGPSVITGITAYFDAQSDTLKGSERVSVFHLQTGEKYKFYVAPSFRGSRDVRLGKGYVQVYYDTRLLTFDEGEYWEEQDRENTPVYDFPFYFTCSDTPAYTEIFVTAIGYWYKVAVIIEN